jgi:hypothetical protein
LFLSLFFCHYPRFLYPPTPPSTTNQFGRPNRRDRPFTQLKSWDHCPARAFRSDCITTFIILWNPKRFVSLTPFKIRRRQGGNLIPSERIGHTSIEKSWRTTPSGVS